MRKMNIRSLKNIFVKRCSTDRLAELLCKGRAMKSAVALWDAACLVSRSLCPENFSLWWVGDENSGFAYANGPPSFFLLFFLKSLF